MSDSSQAWPIATELPPELAFLANHISTYFSSNPPYNRAILGALIFTPPPQEPKLLLVQVREHADPNAFSWSWGVPSGSPQASDLTMLHALARIVHTQTGLHLNRVHMMSGSQVGPTEENPEWINIQFTVSVTELDCDIDPFSLQQTLAHQAGNPENYNFEAAQGHGRDPNTIPVTLNPQTHREHAWATEDDLREFMKSGLYPDGSAQQYQSMLDAFALYKQDYDLVNKSKAKRKESPPLPAPKAPSPARKASTKKESITPTSRIPSKLSRSSSKGSSSKSKPNPSQFHRFRIS